jgi:hypothetical protein
LLPVPDLGTANKPTPPLAEHLLEKGVPLPPDAGKLSIRGFFVGNFLTHGYLKV